jgi:hypothetical protein
VNAVGGRAAAIQQVRLGFTPLCEYFLNALLLAVAVRLQYKNAQKLKRSGQSTTQFRFFVFVSIQI